MAVVKLGHPIVNFDWIKICQGRNFPRARKLVKVKGPDNGTKEKAYKLRFCNLKTIAFIVYCLVCFDML